MPVFADATTDQLNTLRSGGWAGDLRFAINPNTVLWQATVNQTITSSKFISFAWDNTLAGSRPDVVVGMTFFITATDDPLELRTPLLRGRVSQLPSSTIFYCNESGINLTDGMIVTVIALFEILQKDRTDDLVDGFQAWEDLAPIVKNMQSFYYVEDDVEGSFSFAPVGQAMAQGASIASYHWTIAGAVYAVGDDDTRLITATVPYGHTWAYLDVTDTNDVSFRFIFEILVCDRNDTAFMYMAHDNVTINGSVETGWNVTATYFAGVTSLLNRTRAAIVVFDVPREGATDLFNNVAFVGYFVEETTDVTADAMSSILSQTGFQLQSFTAIAGQLPVPSLPVRNDATPDEWGDINLPTPQRTISYLLTRYSTLANLCAIDMLYADSTWFAGEMDLEEGTLLDSINRIGEEIQARLVFFPQGDACFEINANFLSDSDRDALPTLIGSGDLDPQDLFGHSLPVPYYKTVGQVEAGCATFYANGSTAFKLDALAPATARQEGNERPVVLAQLLQANLSQANAVTAARQRIGNLLEYLNPATRLPTAFKDGWRVLTPSTRVWLTYDLPGTDSTRGLAIDPTQRWLLESVALTWMIENGAWDVHGVARLETRGGLSQTTATISPNVIDTSLPVLPILSDYDAFSADGSLNYDSATPDDADRQPYGAFDLSQFAPMTTENAAAAADNTPGPDCYIVSPAVNFSSPTIQTTPLTVNGATYTITVKGRAKISEGSSTSDFTIGEDGWQVLPEVPGFGANAVYHAGEGYGRGEPILTQVLRITKVISTTVTALTLRFNDSFSGNVHVLQNLFADFPGTDIGSASGSTWTFTGLSKSGGLGIQIETPFPFSIPSTVRLIGLTIGEASGNPVYADAIYQWQYDDAGNAINVELNPLGGLLVNGSPLAVPPEWNENSEYTFAYTGDGNVIPFVFYDTDYSDNQNLPLYIRVCGPGMGS